MQMKRIWITWETQRRNWEVAGGIGAKYFEFADLMHIPYYKKYVIGPLRTLKTIWKEKPNVVFCENPSFMLALTVVIFKKVLGYKAVVDTHNDGLLLHLGTALRLVGKFLQRFADVTIVTNTELAKIVEKNGGNAYVLPDRIPNIAPKVTDSYRNRFRVLYVCTYSHDEPYANVFEAARLVPSTTFLISGNYQRKQILERFTMPDNVMLLGYVPRKEYEHYLRNANVVMALSTMTNCLLCGNYEAVAAEKPLVTSDDPAIMKHFNKGTVYCDNTPIGIATAVLHALARQDVLIKEMKELKTRRSIEWNFLANRLLCAVGS